MNQTPDKPAASSNQAPSKVGGAGRKTKYLTVALMIIIVVILSRGFFATPNAKANKSELSTVIKPAEAGAVPLNLDLNLPPTQPTALIGPPAPVIQVIPPPPSVLPPPQTLLNPSNTQAEEKRLKSPSQVYNANENKSAALDNRSATNITSNNTNGAFAQQAANTPVITVTAKRNTHTNYKILQGKLITAVLETAINSDLPGMVRAVVSKDVYGDTGRIVLLPRGTRLIGQYNSSVAVGQTRVMVVWVRAITPQHIDIALGSPNTDSLGQAGMTGQVDSHFWQIFGTSALLSVLGVAGSNINVGGNTGELGVSGNPYQAAVTQGMLNASNNTLQTRINIQPTIQIHQGSPIQVFVARDLDFSDTAFRH